MKQPYLRHKHKTQNVPRTWWTEGYNDANPVKQKHEHIIRWPSIKSTYKQIKQLAEQLSRFQITLYPKNYLSSWSVETTLGAKCNPLVFECTRIATFEKVVLSTCDQVLLNDHFCEQIPKYSKLFLKIHHYSFLIYLYTNCKFTLCLSKKVKHSSSLPKLKADWAGTARRCYLALMLQRTGGLDNEGRLHQLQNCVRVCFFWHHRR